MSKLISRFSISLLILLPTWLMAQKTADYNLRLHSGKFIPAENLGSITKDSKVFNETRFRSKHYVVIQFRSLPTFKEKDELKNGGIFLIDYLPDNAYTAALVQGFSIQGLKNTSARSLFKLQPEHKTPAALLEGKFPAHAVKSMGTVDVTITTYETLQSTELASSFKLLGITIIDEVPMFRNFTLRVPGENFKELISLSFVQWAEAIEPPNKAENLLGRSFHRVNILNDGIRNLKGDGINIGIWDGGEVAKHIDFAPVNSRVTLVETSGVTAHGTHCAGTLGGGGLINPAARGMAPLSKIFSFDFNGNIPAEQAAAIPALGLSVSSHSYGSGTPACGLGSSAVAYSTTSRNTDLNLNNFPNHLHIHSSGNSQTDCGGGWSTITSAGKSCKNNILVADLTTTEAVSATSSFGPVADGRVKPEISSLGTNVLSTSLNNGYASFSGTSMATPGVAGSVALLVERYRQLNGNAEPLSSLIKNTILNSASDLGNIGPDYKFGYGRLNTLSAVRILEEKRFVVNTLFTGSSDNISISVPAGAVKLRVMITWNDPAATANANPALVNNLDLTVIKGADTCLPWILDPVNPANPATTGIDNVGNIEQVTIENPAAGTYVLRVAGTSIPTGPQQYTITWQIDMPYLEVIYPNGSESFSPGSPETITWDNAGVTGLQTIEYSLNNAVSWTTIAESIPATTTRVSWTPPADANTSTALVRVSSGTLSDVSDATFNMLGTPTGLIITPTCESGSLAFAWPAVNNATRYDLLRLDEASGRFVPVATDLTGTSFTATGLTPDAAIWFTLRSKNHLSGAVSERAIAISGVVPGNGFNTIGAVSGPDIICGVTHNVSYSIPVVAGASGYTWSVPAGAIITSGQGTSNILVSFPAASTSGNVTIYASTGSCKTPVALLPVAVNNTLIEAPLGGGNQTQTHCNSSPLPTLTATAHVPADHSVTWYTAPSLGTIVTNPILNSYGSVTYYAASKNNAAGCESTARTPVTLTIVPPPPVLVSANSSLAICLGGSVVLSAPAASSYLWSNGATTRSITASSAGSYSVSIIDGNGCMATSAASMVTVNSIPSVSLTAVPYTRLFPGLSTTLTATAGENVTYTWYKNGMAIAGAIGASLPLTIEKQGSYSVQVTDAMGCINSSSVISITDSASAELFIYPNPNKGQFYVSYYNATATKNIISVYDNKGARVFNKIFTNAAGYQLMPIDTRHHGQGNYRITIRDSNGRKIKTGTVVVL